VQPKETGSCPAAVPVHSGYAYACVLDGCASPSYRDPRVKPAQAPRRTQPDQIASRRGRRRPDAVMPKAEGRSQSMEPFPLHFLPTATLSRRRGQARSRIRWPSYPRNASACSWWLQPPPWDSVKCAQNFPSLSRLWLADTTASTSRSSHAT
jgi:hypothetical protein